MFPNPPTPPPLDIAAADLIDDIIHAMTLSALATAQRPRLTPAEQRDHILAALPALILTFDAAFPLRQNILSGCIKLLQSAQPNPLRSSRHPDTAAVISTIRHHLPE